MGLTWWWQAPQQQMQPPGIQAGLRTAQFGERLLRVVIADEFPVAREPGKIVAQINFFHPVGNLLDAGVVVHPVADQAVGVFAPEFMVLFIDDIRQGHDGVAVDLHDDAEGRLVRIHPFERKTFLDVKFIGRVVVKNHPAQQPVDHHHRDLPGNGNPAAGGVHLHVLALLEPAGRGAVLDITV